MLEPSSYEEAIARVKANFEEAAERALPKRAWLKGLCGRAYYEMVAHSKEWKVISKQYDRITTEAAEEKPRQLLIRALDGIKAKLEAGEGLNFVDIAIYNALQNSNRNKHYLELNRRKHKAEEARAAAEERRKEREEARKDREEQRKEELHKITMETAKEELEARKNGGIFHILELEEMTEEQYLAYQEGREY